MAGESPSGSTNMQARGGLSSPSSIAEEFENERPDQSRSQDSSQRRNSTGENNPADATYPPPRASRDRDTSQDIEQQKLPSLFSIRPISNSWRYVNAARVLSLALVLVNAISAMGTRQITALPQLPGGAGSSSLAKRAAGGELPFDIRFTQKWLAKMFSGTPDPILVLILLFTWVSMSILMSGVIYNAIIEKTENAPVVLSDAEKKAKWYRNKMFYVRRVGRWMGSCVISVVRLVLMDRYPHLGQFWARSGLWTCLRIATFTVQLLIAIIMVRQVLAMASLVAGAETPIPSSLEIPYTLEILKKALPIIQPFPGGMMLLVVVILSAVIIIIPVGWHSLLHPRQKNPQSRTAGQTIKRFLTCQAFGEGISLGRFRRPVVIFLGMVLVACFGACLYYFVEIMKYIGEVGFVKDSGYMDSIGLVGASMIFGIFALPLAYIAFECEDAVRSALESRASKQSAGAK